MTSSVESSDDVEFSEWSDPGKPEMWYVNLGGVRLGPLDREGLLEMYETGNLRADDRIQAVGSQTWLALRSLLKASSQRFDSDISGGDRYLPQLRSEDLSDDSSEDAFEVGAICHVEFDSSSAASSNHSGPQFFFVVNDREVGPVPFDTLQELADAAEIDRTSRVRRENCKNWMAAKDIGIRFREESPPNVDTLQVRTVPLPQPQSEMLGSSEHDAVANISDIGGAGRGVLNGAAWLVLAPIHYVLGLVNGLGSVRRAYALTWAIVALVISWFVYSAYWNWSTTAVTGSIQLNSHPLPSALITLTNMKTGETAVAFSGTSGTFSVRTISGTLSLGKYRVTVTRPTEYESSELPPIPKRYQVLSTSDVNIDYDGSQLTISLIKD